MDDVGERQVEQAGHAARRAARWPAADAQASAAARASCKKVKHAVVIKKLVTPSTNLGQKPQLLS